MPLSTCLKGLPAGASLNSCQEGCVWWLWQIPTQCVLLGTPSGDRGSYLDSGALSQGRYWQLKKQAFLQACGSFPPVFTIRRHEQWLSVQTCIWVARTHIKPEAAARVCAPTTHGELTGQLSWCVHWWTRTPSWSGGRWAHAHTGIQTDFCIKRQSVHNELFYFFLFIHR